MRLLPAILLALASAALAACGGSDVRPRRLDVAGLDEVHRWPGRYLSSILSSPDGAVFVAFDSSLWRGERGRWRRVSMIDGEGRSKPRAMYAPSRGTVYLADAAFIYRWSEGRGFRMESTPIDTQAVACGDFSSGEQVWALAGRGEDDVYAVGLHGLIVHYDGRRWRQEPNPLRARAPSHCSEAFPTDLFAVAVADGEVMAAGGSILRRTRRGWVEVPRPAGGVAQGFVHAMAASGDAIVMAGHDFRRVPGARDPVWAGYLLRADGARLRVDSLGERGIGELYGGGGHPGGPAVFWGPSGAVVVVRGDRIRLYIVRGMRMRGAIPVRGEVYVAGWKGDTSIVARLPR